MINQGNDVPEKTIALFRFEEFTNLNMEDIIKKPNKKRDWAPWFVYNCLPFMVANEYGFNIVLNCDINFIWNGGDAKEDLQITYIENKETKGKLSPEVKSDFGHGIITISTPFVLRTPPGINLMTISPPNEILKNLTVLTGSVESDNIRMPFTLNLRVQEPNVLTHIPAGTPLSTIIPIPRYFADGFTIKNAEDLFEDSVVVEEVNALYDHQFRREFQKEYEKQGDPLFDRLYLKGRDIYNNIFPNHQR